MPISREMIQEGLAKSGYFHSLALLGPSRTQVMETIAAKANIPIVKFDEAKGHEFFHWAPTILAATGWLCEDGAAWANRDFNSAPDLWNLARVSMVGGSVACLWLHPLILPFAEDGPKS